MTTFTIENEKNHITAHATTQDAGPISNAQWFRSEAELAELAAGWPAARLVAIWTSLPGVTPLKRFQDRKTAIARIWNAIETSGRTGAPQAASEAAPDPSAPATEPESVLPFPESALPSDVALLGDQ